MTARPLPLSARIWWQPLLLGLAYYVSASVALLPSATLGGAAFIWPANALLLACLLRRPRARWPAFMLAAFAAECAADLPSFTLLQALGFGVVNLSEAGLAALFLSRIEPGRFTFGSLRNAVAFGVGVIGLICAVAGAASSVIYRPSGGGPESFLTDWQLWWLGDGLGLLVLTPALLDTLDATPVTPRRGARWELTVLLGLGLLASLMVFSNGDATARASPAGPVLLFPLAIWAAARFGARSVAAVTLIVGGTAIVYTAKGLGPFADGQSAHAALLLQAYLACFAGCSLAVAAMLTELRQRNAELRLRERAMESIGEGVVISDPRQPDMPVIYVNRSFEQLTGYSAQEVLGRNCRFLQGDDRDQASMKPVGAALARGEPVRALVRNYRKDGRLFLNDLTLTPVRDEHGQLCAYIGIQHDMTAQHDADLRLREAHADLTRANQALEERVVLRTRELEVLNEQLDNLAHTDTLTGIWNRRYFLAAAARAVAASRRHGRPLSLLMIDVDHFKAINDEHGHSVGDQALITLTRALRSTLRPTDVLARFGGEEFVALLIDSDLADALSVAERWRLDVAQQRTRHQDHLITFTISIGVAQWQNDFDVDQLVRVADERLYAAKADGRNRVCV